MMTELERLQKKVADALRAKVAANAALDTSVAAFFKVEAAVIQDEKTYYKSDNALDKVQLALSNFLEEQDK